MGVLASKEIFVLSLQSRNDGHGEIFTFRRGFFGLQQRIFGLQKGILWGKELNTRFSVAPRPSSPLECAPAAAVTDIKHISRSISK